jgi:hypothetical protein
MGAEAEKELKKIPFFVRGKARRNTERYAAERGLTPSHSRRCTMPKRISAADATPIARRHRDARQPHGGAVERARRCKRIAGPALTLHGGRVGGSRSGTLERCKATSRAATSSSPTCCSWKTTSARSCPAGGAARRLRLHGRLPVGRRGGELTRLGGFSMSEKPGRRDGAAQALRGAARSKKPRGASR